MIKTLLKSCLNFIFPQSCIHCKELISFQKFLCKFCLEQLELKDPLEAVIKPQDSYEAQAYCFESIGPIVSLVASFNSKRNSVLAKFLASYALIQWWRLKWPQPDIIYVQSQSKRFWSVEEDPLMLFAKSFAELMSCPLLKQNSFIVRMKEALAHAGFAIHQQPIEEKTVLQIGLGDKYDTVGILDPSLQHYKHRYKLTVLL